jgi:hypothetical protein
MQDGEKNIDDESEMVSLKKTFYKQNLNIQLVINLRRPKINLTSRNRI